MLIRLLIILMLLIQPLGLSVAMTSGSSGSSESSAACDAASCCEVVERTICCDEVVREMRCGKTGGECRCAVRPVGPEPAPAAPRSQERNDIGPLLLAAARTVVDVPVRAPTLVRRMTPVIHRTHTETQALLCIWRT